VRPNTAYCGASSYNQPGEAQEAATVTELRSSSSASPEPKSGRLESWKQIAQYLQRDESTVQRWEKREGMPVHRHVHDKRGSVYAFAGELDAWWRSRRHQLDPPAADALEPRIEGRPGGRTAQHGYWKWAAGVLTGIVAVVAILMAWKLKPSDRPAASVNQSLIRLTSTSGLNIDPALSPDGTLLAYASDRAGAGNLDIWVQPTREEGPVRITSDPGDEIEPSFSPDGAVIVFSKREGGLYAVRALGGDARVIVPASAHEPRLSPDGGWVTYWTGLPGWEMVGPPGASGSQFIAPMAGGVPRELAAHFDARHGIWSPDGQAVLFLGPAAPAADGSSYDWYLARLDGARPIQTGAVRALRDAGVSGLPVPGGWGPEGVTFALHDQDRSTVWRLGISTSTGHVMGAPQRLTFGTAIEQSPTISVSGRVALTSVVENRDVWRVPLDSRKGLVTGTLERVTDNASDDDMQNASDDGRAMAFFSSRSGRGEIWLKDLVTGRERQVTYAGGVEGGRINHEGTVIAVNTSVGVDLVPATGGPASRFCDDCGIADWSADDANLLIARIVRNGAYRLSVRERVSGREMVLAEHPIWSLYQARFSPDGRWVAFHTTNSSSLRQVYAVPTFAERPVPFAKWIPVVADSGFYPDWSPDGAAIYHFSIRDGAICAWLQPLDPNTKRPSGPPRAVRHFHQPRLRGGPDGHLSAGFLYLTLTETLGNIWMLEGHD
jgi:Tol biopolymer transport system component